MVDVAILPLFSDQLQGGQETTMIDAQEFEAFVRNYQNMVFSLATRILGNAVDAEDIAQEVFIKAFDHFAELQRSKTAGGWLKTVATNLSINYLNRYRARWRFFSEEAFLPDPPAPAEHNGDRQEMIDWALTKLPDSQRVPLVLYHFQDLSYEEIATQLGVSLSKVKIDLFRGREALKKILEKLQ
jgi:RNA polymerase sigma-70 factor, ECF subfamily